jgi:hypothetical protein
LNDFFQATGLRVLTPTPDFVVRPDTLILLADGNAHAVPLRATIPLPDGLPEYAWMTGAPRAVAALRFEGRLVTIFDIETPGTEDPLRGVFLHIVAIASRLVGLLTYEAGPTVRLPADLLNGSPEFEPISDRIFLGDDVDDVLSLPDLGDLGIGRPA